MYITVKDIVNIIVKVYRTVYILVEVLLFT